jgi:L,D-transpeptidase ErfK/SrfK
MWTTALAWAVAAALSGGVSVYTVVPGDTLVTLAARFGVDAGTIARDNNVDVRGPLPAGRELRIDNRHIIPESLATGEIVVNIPQRMVFYRDEGEVFAYPAAVGRSTWRTPTGEFTVAGRQTDPAWHVPASIRAESARSGRQLPAVVAPGPRNPLGRFWIGLSLQSIGIHGTPSPSSVYQAATHGCLRLQANNIAELYQRVAVGTRGRIVYEPILMVAQGSDVFIEVHEDVYRQLVVTPQQQARDMAARLGLNDRIDWTAADREIERRAGVARRISP